VSLDAARWMRFPSVALPPVPDVLLTRIDGFLVGSLDPSDGDDVGGCGCSGFACSFSSTMSDCWNWDILDVARCNMPEDGSAVVPVLLGCGVAKFTGASFLEPCDPCDFSSRLSEWEPWEEWECKWC